eukprot:COSAG01_NODE_676_length_14324_cov_17.420105_8_plen_93_part_00
MTGIPLPFTLICGAILIQMLIEQAAAAAAAEEDEEASAGTLLLFGGGDGEQGYADLHSLPLPAGALLSSATVSPTAASMMRRARRAPATAPQ